MSSASAASKLAPTPRKSSSLLIFSPTASATSPDYELLMLKRKGNMSFANALAFPGGVLDKTDVDLLKFIRKNQFPTSLRGRTVHY